MEGTGTPDCARCVDISTDGALKKMVVPSMMAVIVPVIVGIVFGIGGVIGMLAGGLGTGFAVAIFMANAGGSWDNTKKWIESGELGGKYLKNAAGEYVDANGHKVARKEVSKNPRHGATVVGDTVGDPFRDTFGSVAQHPHQAHQHGVGGHDRHHDGRQQRRGLVKALMEMLLR
jgi:K(+)-stimulated pyrophosphate-energized sodium pump